MGVHVPGVPGGGGAAALQGDTRHAGHLPQAAQVLLGLLQDGQQGVQPTRGGYTGGGWDKSGQFGKQIL